MFYNLLGVVFIISFFIIFVVAVVILQKKSYISNMDNKIKNWLFPVSDSRRRGIDIMKNPKIGRRIILASTNIKSNKAVIVKIDGKYHKVRELGVASTAE